VRRSSVLDNAFVSSIRFAELEGGPPEGTGPGKRSRGWPGQTRLEAEWAAKMNKAFERGLAQGEARAAEKTALLVKALGEAQQRIADFKARLEVEAEKQAVELAVKLAETVIRTQVLFDAGVLRSALDEALQRAPEGSVARVRVNPDDLAAAQSLEGALPGGAADIVADGSIGRGGCIVETNMGEINSTVEHRWEAAQKLLREALPAEDPHG